MRIAKRAAGFLATALVALAGGAAHAQYPQKPIKLVVPFIAGSAPDTVARAVGDRLAQRLGQPIVVENRGGAGGNIGAEIVAKASADGYTLMLATSSHVTNPSLYARVAYDPLRDFTHIALLSKLPSLLVVPAELPVRDVKSLVAMAKAKPGALNYASGGPGSLAHLCGATFQKLAGIDVVHIPYKGAPEIVTSLLSERSQYAFPTFGTALPHVKAGKLRALAVTGPKRNPQLPDVPTMAEAFPPGFELEGWLALWGPAGIPADVVKRINAEVDTILKDPDFRSKISSDGSEVATATPEEFTAYVKSEVVKWDRAVKDAGAKVD